MVPLEEPVILYVDDGHPESRDYDDNYLVVDSRRARSLLRRWLGLPAKPAPSASGPVRHGRSVGEPLPA